MRTHPPIAQPGLIRKIGESSSLFPIGTTTYFNGVALPYGWEWVRMPSGGTKSDVRRWLNASIT